MGFAGTVVRPHRSDLAHGFAALTGTSRRRWWSRGRSPRSNRQCSRAQPRARPDPPLRHLQHRGDARGLARRARRRRTAPSTWSHSGCSSSTPSPPLLGRPDVRADRRGGDRCTSYPREPAGVLAGDRSPASRALFALDSFGGGFVTQAFVACWFPRRGEPRRRRSASSSSVSACCRLARCRSLSASRPHRSAAARWCSPTYRRTICLSLIPRPVFMPTAPLAIAVVLARSALSQMDVPARTVLCHGRRRPRRAHSGGRLSRTRRGTSSARSHHSSPGPIIAVSLGAPFVIAGALKSVYDRLALYVALPHVPSRQPATISDGAQPSRRARSSRRDATSPT